MTGKQQKGLMDRVVGVEEPNRSSARRSEVGLISTTVRPIEADDRLEPGVSPRVVLAVLWLCHFLLWTFGDMFALLQGIGEAVTEPVFLVVAPTTAIVQASMAALSLMGTITLVRRANLMIAPLYLLLNVGFFVDASHLWEYYLGVFYLGFSLLIIRFASKLRVASSERTTAT